MKNQIKNDLVCAYSLYPEDAESVANIIIGYLTQYENDEILEQWVETLTKGTVYFNHDMDDGYYVIKHDGRSEIFVHMGDLRRYIRHKQLNPVWAGAKHYEPADFATFYTIVDVPSDFVHKYKTNTL